MRNTKNLFRLAVIAPLLFLITTANIKVAKASINSETSQTYNLTAGDFKLEDFDYQNNTKAAQTIKVSSYSYDVKTGLTTADAPTVTVSQPNVTLNAGDVSTIKYLISVPQTQALGTYFNVINIQIVNKKGVGDSNLVSDNLKDEMAILFTLHVEDANTTYSASFVKDSDTKLMVVNPGFPYLSPMTIRYTYTNKSPYVFQPNGKLGVYESGALLPETTFDFNAEKANVYPNEEISKTVTLDVWNNLSNILSSKKISINTYDGSSDNYFTNEIQVNILPQLIAAGIFALSIIILIIVLIVSAIKAVVNKIKGLRKDPAKEAITD